MSDVSRLLSNVASMTVMRLLTAALSFSLLLIMARHWGAARLGEFSTVLAFFMLLQHLPLLGLHLPVARRIAAAPDDTAGQAVNALLLALPVAVVLVFAFGFLGQAWYPPSMQAAFWLIGAACLPTAFTVVGEAVLTGRECMKAVAGIYMVENVSRVAVGLLLVYSGAGLTQVITAFVLARIGAAAVFWRMAGLKRLCRGGVPGAGALAELVRRVPVFFAIMVLSVGFGRLDTIVLSKMGTMRDVGLYTPALRVYELAVMVPSMLAYVIYPMFSRYYGQSQDRFDSLSVQLVRAILLVGVPLVLLAAYLSTPVMTAMFGAQYARTGSVLHVLSFAVLFVALDQLLTVVLLSGHHEGIDLKVIGIAFVAYAVLLVVLIPRFGIQGAGVATLAAAAARLLIRFAYAVKAMRIPLPGTELLKGLAAGAPMAVILYAAPGRHFVITAVAAVAVYLVCALLIGSVTQRDVSRLRQALMPRDS